ncbi:MAG: hypothetical protein LBJ02_11115 [Bifidobacteriaceae bacterium]|nr:hypothetical protein [Bifidobacteriaceae bacterium]
MPAPRAALSHQTAPEAYELSDVNPDKIHVTIPVREQKLRRRDTPPAPVVHYQNLADGQIGWWEGIPAVVAALQRPTGDDAVPLFLVKGGVCMELRFGLEARDRHKHRQWSCTPPRRM